MVSSVKIAISSIWNLSLLHNVIIAVLKRAVAAMIKSAHMGCPTPSSINHQHLLSVIAAEMRDRSDFKIADVGCGGGALMRYLRAALPEILPGREVQVSGFDVSDFAPHGNTNLGTDTKTVRTGEPWPYPDHSLDVILSNQVLEHVFDQ